MKYLRIGMLALVVVLLAAATVVLSQSEKKDKAVSQYTGVPCAEHGIADSLCTRCHPELAAIFKKKGDWCPEHRMPESQDDLCNPKLAKKGIAIATKTDETGEASSGNAEIDWCSSHRVPESLCTKCKPELAAKFKADGDWCNTHGVPESHCYQCNPDLKFAQEADYLRQQTKGKSESGVSVDGHPETALYRTNATSCATDQAVIQLTSVETAQRAGLLVEEAQAASVPEMVDAPGEVAFDASSSYAVTSLVGGTVVRWLVQPGEKVRQGQTLAYLQSIEGASLKAECSHAQAVLDLSKNSYERAKALNKDGMNSARELQEAEAEYLRAQADCRKAEGGLKALGLSDSDIKSLSNNDGSSATIPLRAGQSGILVDQRAALGAVLSPGESVGLISSTDKLWVEAQIRERDISRVKTGQPVTISSDGQSLNRCQGTVTWIAASVDPSTRMGKVRIETHPNGNSLKAHQFVRVQISTSTSEETILVPVEAVQWEGCCNIVFVSETRDRFRPRKVKVEFVDGQNYAVSGLKPGEKIVTHGSYMLKTELMKGSIGAGCCGEGA
jgi:cobalt-zinc-cadmium efflux system membrane fusion protein